MSEDIRKFYDNAGYVLKQIIEKQPNLLKSANIDNIYLNLRNGKSLKRQLIRLQEVYKIKEEKFQCAFEYIISFEDFNLTGKTGFTDYEVTFEQQLL